MKKPKQLLIQLITISNSLGLPDKDLDFANDYLNYFEYGLCFDTLITQLYEYEIEITEDIYALICTIASEMKIPEENYIFMKKLIHA